MSIMLAVENVGLIVGIPLESKYRQETILKIELFVSDVNGSSVAPLTTATPSTTTYALELEMAVFVELRLPPITLIMPYVAPAVHVETIALPVMASISTLRTLT